MANNMQQREREVFVTIGFEGLIPKKTAIVQIVIPSE